MKNLPDRYDRNIRFFGKDGQQKLRQIKVTLIGVGGLGSALAQHLALLGVGSVILVDDEELDESNRNRFIGAQHNDPIPGSPKVKLAKRLIAEINPDVETKSIPKGLVTVDAFDAVKSSDWVFGCFDEDGPRFILNELCSAYEIPYIDLASDIHKTNTYGGRICISWDGWSCLYCLKMLDMGDVNRYLSSDVEQTRVTAIYGVPDEVLDETGPSVSPLNGIVASVAAMEFMLAATKIRDPQRLINFQGHASRLTLARPRDGNCPYCEENRSQGTTADVERYLKLPHLASRRAR